MAEQLKPADKKASGIAATDLKRVVKDILRHKAAASDNSGLAGQATKQAIEQYSLDRKALSTVVSLSKQEPAQAQGTLRAMLDYSDKLGLFDAVDAFDDLIPIMERIVQRAKNVSPPHGKPSGKDNPIDSMLKGVAADPVH